MDDTSLIHSERFEAMKKEVDGRTTHWYFKTPVNNQNRQTELFQGLIQFTAPMGLFEHDYFGNECMEIPRIGKRSQSTDDVKDKVLGMASTSVWATNISRCAWDASEPHTHLDITGAYVQLATTTNGDLIVVASQAFTIKYESAYYEHPPGYRLVLAMKDQLYPEWAISLFRCRPLDPPNWATVVRNESITDIYKQRLIDDVDDEEFKMQIFNQWNV